MLLSSLCLWHGDKSSLSHSKNVSDGSHGIAYIFQGMSADYKIPLLIPELSPGLLIADVSNILPTLNVQVGSSPLARPSHLIPAHIENAVVWILGFLSIQILYYLWVQVPVAA